jgi:hypothetical protein
MHGQNTYTFIILVSLHDVTFNLSIVIITSRIWETIIDATTNMQIIQAENSNNKKNIWKYFRGAIESKRK